MLLDEGVVCEGDLPLADPSLTSLQDELPDRLQVGESVGSIERCYSEPIQHVVTA